LAACEALRAGAPQAAPSCRDHRYRDAACHLHGGQLPAAEATEDHHDLVDHHELLDEHDDVVDHLDDNRVTVEVPRLRGRTARTVGGGARLAGSTHDGSSSGVKATRFLDGSPSGPATG